MLGGALKSMKHEPRKEKAVNESEVEYLGFLCVLLQCTRQRKTEGMGRNGGGGEKEIFHLRNETVHWDADDKNNIKKRAAVRKDEAASDIKL